MQFKFEVPEEIRVAIYADPLTEEQQIACEMAMFAEDVLRGEITEKEFEDWTGKNYQEYLYEEEMKNDKLA